MQFGAHTRHTIHPVWPYKHSGKHATGPGHRKKPQISPGNQHGSAADRQALPRVTAENGSRESPAETVATILALADSEEISAVERLVYLSAVNQPADHIPAIIVLLRRKDRPWVADLLIDILTGKKFGWLSKIGLDRYVSIVSALRSATMERDAHGRADLVLELAASFSDKTYGDRETILSSVAKGSNYHLKSLFEELRTTTIKGIDPKGTRDRIIFGIPYDKSQEIASYLESEGMNEEAQRVLELEGQPPF